MSPLPIAAAIAGVVVLALGVVALTRPPPEPPPWARQAPPAPALVEVVKAAPVVIDRTGPVRVSVLPFKGEHPQAPGLGDGCSEAVVTELAGAAGVKLIERGQVDVEIKELDFQQSKYVDPATRAAIGKIGGAEIVILGNVGSVGDQVRLTARFVDVESGEVLATAKTDGAVGNVFVLQDQLAAAVKQALPEVRARIRP